MKMRESIIIFAAAIGISIYLMTPGCGNKSSDNVTSPYYGTGVTCLPGQICNSALGVNGVPLINAPAVASLDSQGSYIAVSFGGTSVVGGQSYTGQVSIGGQINLAPSVCGGYGGYGTGITCQFSGTGTWASNYGGALGAVQGQAQLSCSYGAGMVQFGSSGSDVDLVYAGTDPLNYQSGASGYYIHGNVTIQTPCGTRVFTAL